MIRINLLPVRAARKKEEVQRQLILFTVFLLVVLGVMTGILQSNRSTLSGVQVDNKQLEAEIADLKKIIGEVAAARKTERGGRMDDKRSQSAMEDRKKEGYF